MRGSRIQRWICRWIGHEWEPMGVMDQRCIWCHDERIVL